MDSLRHLTGASISADDLFERYKIACDLKQTPDLQRIEVSVRSWATAIGITEVTVKFVRNVKEVGVAAWDARDARDARAARAASAAWAASAASAAWADSAAENKAQADLVRKWYPVPPTFKEQP